MKCTGPINTESMSIYGDEAHKNVLKHRVKFFLFKVFWTFYSQSLCKLLKVFNLQYTQHFSSVFILIAS